MTKELTTKGTKTAVVTGGCVWQVNTEDATRLLKELTGADCIPYEGGVGVASTGALDFCDKSTGLGYTVVYKWDGPVDGPNEVTYSISRNEVWDEERGGVGDDTFAATKQTETTMTLSRLNNGRFSTREGLACAILDYKGWYDYDHMDELIERVAAVDDDGMWHIANYHDGALGCLVAVSVDDAIEAIDLERAAKRTHAATMRRLESLLLDAYDAALEAKWQSEPRSRDRRRLMFITSALESVIDTVQS